MGAAYLVGGPLCIDIMEILNNFQHDREHLVNSPHVDIYTTISDRQ